MYINVTDGGTDGHRRHGIGRAMHIVAQQKNPAYGPI